MSVAGAGSPGHIPLGCRAVRALRLFEVVVGVQGSQVSCISAPLPPPRPIRIILVTVTPARVLTFLPSQRYWPRRSCRRRGTSLLGSSTSCRSLLWCSLCLPHLFDYHFARLLHTSCITDPSRRSFQAPPGSSDIRPMTNSSFALVFNP